MIELERDSYLSKKERRYLRRYAKKINRRCCEMKDKRLYGYQIGYIGYKFCKVARCLDCDKLQVLCGRFGKWLIKRRLRKGKMRMVVECVLSNDTIFRYQ